MKLFMKILSLLSACLLLACGCADDPQKAAATIYCINEQKDGLTQKQIEVGELSAQGLIDALSSAGVLSSSITVHNFQKSVSTGAESTIRLDLSIEFSQYIANKSATEEDLIMGCVANTFLSNYGADRIFITVEDQIIKTDHFEYTQELSFYEFSGGKLITPQPGTEDPVMPTPSSTPTPTPSRDPGKKQVAFTFDDGPHAEYTVKIVDKLKEYGASATFFIVGNRVNSDSTRNALRYAAENGCEIGIHGYTHKVYYNKCTDEEYQMELEETAKVIEECIGKRPTLMRPIGGNITKERIDSCPYSVIFWNVDSEDWKNKQRGSEEEAAQNIQTIVQNVMSTVGDGKIILMHEIYRNSYEAFCIILDELYQQGYEVVSVTELIGADTIKPGQKYSCR